MGGAEPTDLWETSAPGADILGEQKIMERIDEAKPKTGIKKRGENQSNLSRSH